MTTMLVHDQKQKLTTEQDIDKAYEFLVNNGPHIIAFLATMNTRIKVTSKDTLSPAEKELCEVTFSFIDSSFTSNIKLIVAIKFLSSNEREVYISTSRIQGVRQDEILPRATKLINEQRGNLRSILKSDSKLVGNVLRSIALTQPKAVEAEHFLLANYKFFADYYLDSKEFDEEIRMLATQAPKETPLDSKPLRESMLMMTSSLTRNTHLEMVDKEELAVNDLDRFKWVLTAANTCVLTTIDDEEFDLNRDWSLKASRVWTNELRELLRKNPFLVAASLSCKKNLAEIIERFNLETKPIPLRMTPSGVVCPTPRHPHSVTAGSFTAFFPDLESTATAGIDKSNGIPTPVEIPVRQQPPILVNEDESGTNTLDKAAETNHI